MPYDPNLRGMPVGSPAESVLPQSTDDEFSANVMRLYLENLQQLSRLPVPEVPGPSKRERRLSAWGVNTDVSKADRERPQQEAILQRQSIIQNLGALEPILAAHLRAQQAQMTTPNQLASLGLRAEGLEETKRHNLVTENKPRQSLPRAVYDVQGRAHEWTPGSNEPAPRIRLQGGAEASKPATEADIQAAENIKATRLAFQIFRTSAQAYIGDPSKGVNPEAQKSRPGAFGQQIVNRLGETGQAISESVDPQFDLMLKARQRILNSLAKEVERGRLTDEDILRASRTLPTAASLSTPEGRSAFLPALQQAEADILTRLEARTKLRPQVMREATGDPAMDLWNEIESEYGEQTGD